MNTLAIRHRMIFAKATGAPDGSRLLDVTTDRLWLVISGRRHHVTTIGVHQKLFRPSVYIQRVSNDLVFEIKEGPELLNGSCLVRADKRTTIHLLAVFPTKVVLHPIPSTEVFDKYGFDYSLCETLPKELFDKMNQSRPLS